MPTLGSSSGQQNTPFKFSIMSCYIICLTEHIPGLVHPSILEVKQNSSANFTCGSSDKVVWTQNDGLKPANSREIITRGQSVIIISSVQIHNGGIYTCHYVEDMVKYLDLGTLFIVGESISHL